MSKKDDEDQKLRTFTGWKLDLMRAVRANHKTVPGGKSAFAALIDYVNQETKQAWPSEVSLAIALGCSVKSVRKYLSNLIEANPTAVRPSTRYQTADEYRP